MGRQIPADLWTLGSTWAPEPPHAPLHLSHGTRGPMQRCKVSTKCMIDNDRLKHMRAIGTRESFICIVHVYLKFIELPLSQRKFCQRCQQLLLPDDWEKHREHQVMGDISVTQLKRPSQLLSPLENKKTNAQYLFADRSCQFLIDLLSTLGFRRVLCVGTPRLHELIRLKASGDKKPNIKSLLLDIDFRYSQFYMEDSFCHYNMFNHHFFDGEAALEVCRTFLQEDKGEGVIMVTDPPFGGLVEPLAVTFKKLIAMWKKGQNQDNNHKELPIFWIFPYFFESRICQFFPSFHMLDYQVDYDNHALYKHGKTGRKQSPVRIFTNIPPNKIILPVEEGYRAVRKQKQRKSNKMKMETTKGQAMNHTSVTRKKKRRERALNIFALKCPVT
ncbi:Zinc finger CCHC domain-containing protein 4 [Myotis brandtii]|uniref:Zinc finger CCHC domain-containing protein 4 n=1 Tax=Myotis brandtii TaxID=109478 RepID=S7NEC2_MYOBR|nr:Zinc finger CCHC domain-containing protein 4 [Myotis brandtii]